MTKAPIPAPPGATTYDLSALAAAMTAQALSVPAPGGPWGSTFGPGVPLVPQPIDPGSPLPPPRRTDFPSSVNLQVTRPSPLAPWEVLRQVADVDLPRRCIEVRKAQLLALDWDVTLAPGALKRIMAQTGETSPGRAAQAAREKYEPVMARLREWWTKPDPLNGLNFSDWLGMLLEEHFVLDAVAIWPRPTLGGGLASFEIIDGATVKPLLDHRGAVPQPPFPAFQQVLRGFPRGNFVAGEADGEFQANELVYRRGVNRTWTPYGNSLVEQALAHVDLYLKRIHWIRGEFTEGTTPDTWLKQDAGPQSMDAPKMAAVQALLTAVLAGNASERRGVRLLPPGLEPVEMQGFAEKYNPDLDEYIIKLLCMDFGVMPTEVGFPPKSGIGGKGHQEGEANSAYRKSVRPMVTWLMNLLTDLSRSYLGMPPELAFSFLGWQVEDQTEAEKVLDSRVRGGRMTVNEARAEVGMPMMDYPEADALFTVNGSGMVFIEGALTSQATGSDPVEPVAAADPASAVDRAADPSASAEGEGGEGVLVPVDDNGDGVPDGYVRVRSYQRRAKVREEAAKFVTFTKRREGASWRPFTFEHLPKALAVELNATAAGGDLAGARVMAAEVRKGRVPAKVRARVVAEHAGPLTDAVAGLFQVDALVAGWQAQEFGKSAAAEAQRWVAAQIAQADRAPVVAALHGFMASGYRTAWSAASGEDPEWDEEDDESAEPGSRFAGLKAAAKAAAPVAVAAAVGLVASTLMSGGGAGEVRDALADEGAAEHLLGIEATATFTAGTQDGSKRAGIAKVRLVAEAGDCEFCDGYTGRVMDVDHDPGMPPLHAGCQCDIEPVEGDE